MTSIKLGLWTLLVVVGFSAAAAPGDLVKMESIVYQAPGLSSMTRFKLCPAAGNIGRDYGYTAYRITFRTNSVDGREVNSQGLLIKPGSNDAMPVFVYQHGTVFARSELPSAFTQFMLGEVTAIANCYSSAGYVTIIADYLGFGDGTGVHPFLHADSEAWVARDMMRASQTAMQQLRIRTNSKLFIGGYSQGGHAAMALLRMLENDPAREFQVTAGAPMAGPYDLEVTSRLVLEEPTVNSSAEIAYILNGLNPLYSFYKDALEAIKPEYVVKVITLFDGTKDWKDVGKALDMTPAELLQPDFIQYSLNNAASPFRYAMDMNRVYWWTPKAPMTLYHGGGDKDVPFANSQLAYDYFKSVGADARLVNLGSKIRHREGATLAFGESLMWFETF